MVVKTKFFPAPMVAAQPGTLLEHIEFTDGIANLDPASLYDSYACLTSSSDAVWPCPFVYAAVPVQAPLATAGAGGTVPADEYFVVVTALTPDGETTASNQRAITTTGATSTVTVSWAEIDGATGYRIYVGQTTGDTHLLDEVDGGDTLAYIWDGTPAYSGATAAPPTVNTAQIQTSKDFESPEWQDGFRFQNYMGVTCALVGFDRARGDAELSSAYARGESVGIEKALMTQRFVENVGSWAEPDDLTPAGGAVTPEVGLAILEGFARGAYNGVPLLHVPASVGSYLAGEWAIELQAGKAYTRLGSKVAVGAGYEIYNQGPDGSEPDEGEFWVYVSGAVSAARSDLDVKEGFAVQQNTVVLLAERAYVGVVDCFVAAVRVKLYDA